MPIPKDVEKVVKIQLPAGQATPAPPVGPALGPTGINLAEFCRSFNERTKDNIGMIYPVVLFIKKNKSYTFDIKTPPAAVLLRKEAGLAKGSGQPNKNKVGKVTKAQVKKIAEIKIQDMNAFSISSAMRMVEGTARSMGIEITE